MNVQDRLRQAITDEQYDLIASVPRDRQAAIVSLVRARDRAGQRPRVAPVPDLVTGFPLTILGASKALHLCFLAFDDESDAAPISSNLDLETWAAHLLNACRHLAEAEFVLAHCETGFMDLAANHGQSFDAWIASRRIPTSWRERADMDWWAASLAKQSAPVLHALQSTNDASSNGASYYRQIGDTYLKAMAYQCSYPSDAVIGACTVQTYLDILGLLIGWALQERDRGEQPGVQSEHTLVSAIAAELAIDPFVTGEALSSLIVDQESAPYHSAVPGVASAPLILIAPDRIVWSLHGLTSEPLLFLTRELRRRDAQAYHNTAYLREAVFRKDLYTIFSDKRFVTSTNRIELRRKVGDVRTDIDAAVFDRKTGTLGIFELKSQDPFARSTAELTRQRDNILYANRQISGTLDWTNRHGGDEILNRIDSRTAKTFRVQKVLPFVLGRYLAHFNDGPAPDPRAAWATWPQLLRALDGKPIAPSDANPIASLFNRLSKLDSPIQIPTDALPHTISIGESTLTVHPSYAAYQAAQRATSDE